MCAALSSTDWARPRPLASQETPGFGVGKLSSHLSFCNSLRVGTMQAAGRVPGFRVAGRRHCVAPAASSEANGKRPEPRTTYPCPLTCMMLTRNGPSYPWQVSLGPMRPPPTASPRRYGGWARLLPPSPTSPISLGAMAAARARCAPHAKNRTRMRVWPQDRQFMRAAALCSCAAVPGASTKRAGR